jgi:hypothetical protein
MKNAEQLVVQSLESRLDDFEPAGRRAALEELAAHAAEGRIELPPAGRDVNLHCHTFFSYNARGWSPSHFAWLARRRGLGMAGMVDFDVLDGLEEFLAAGRLLGLRTLVGLETRVFVPEFAELEINSPGEPGVAYHIGVGFRAAPSAGSAAAAFLARLKATAQARNRELVDRVNRFLAPVELDFEKDVLALTPAGNPTERHAVLAYARKARRLYPRDEDLAGWWSARLGMPASVVASWLPEGPDLLNLIRARTMKKGGAGYVQPERGSFPTLAETNAFILQAGGIPTVGWLDGASAGERQMERWLEVCMASGAAAINIIPDRNYRPGVADEKLANLHAVVTIAERLGLPVVVGTEMNSPGQKFVDDFASAELAPLLPVFLRGAESVYAHSIKNA